MNDLLEMQKRLEHTNKKVGESDIDPFEADILALDEEEYSLLDIQEYLEFFGVSISISAISRWLKNHTETLK